MGGFEKFCWIVTILASLAAAGVLATAVFVREFAAPQEALLAVVGVQPFGGSGLSGTGPKAGGPLYLGRLQLVSATPSGETSWPAHS